MYQSGYIRPHFKDGVTAFVLALHVGTNIVEHGLLCLLQERVHKN
jgi:hypothetical protein